MQYYFLTTILPPLRIGEPADISFEELMHLIRINALPHDQRKSDVIRRYYDILNVRRFWEEKPLERYGTLDQNRLEEALLTGEGLPSYVYAFMDQYEQKADKLAHFSALLETFFRVEIPRSSGFVRWYLSFERNWRLIMLAARAKKLGRDLVYELQFEDPNDPLVAQLLAQKDAKEFEPPEGFEDMKDIFQTHSEDPFELHQALAQYRFDAIESRVESKPFSYDRVLGYVPQLIMVEKEQELDRKQGIRIIDTVLKDAV